MALYTILFGISIFMIALVMAIIKKMFFHWKEEHKIEQMVVPSIERPAVSVIIYTDKCMFRKRWYLEDACIYDMLSKSDVSLAKRNFEESLVYTTPDTVHSDTSKPLDFMDNVNQGDVHFS